MFDSPSPKCPASVSGFGVPARLFVQVFALLVLGICLSLAGCSDSTGPGTSSETGTEGAAALQGNLDPSAESFVLRTLHEPVPGFDGPIPIQLIGSDLQIDPATETVSLNVVIQNQWTRPLHEPILVWLNDFTPDEVTVLNADILAAPIPHPPPWDPEPGPITDPDTLLSYGFDYSELIGDGVLQPGEASSAKTWEFHVPGLVGFSFAARATFGLIPNLPRIAGICFEDVNRNGELDSRDQPLPGGWVVMHDPNGETMMTHPGRIGYYAFSVRVPGLYRLAYRPSPRPLHQDPVFTTPNPLEVLLPANPDGMPQSFLAAHFGVFFQSPFDTIPPVILTEAPLDSLVGAPYEVLRLGLHSDIFSLKVGFSGCQPEHPFTLYMVGGFMESWPVRANLVLVHELDEDCDAYFTAELHYSLLPIQRAYREAYGEHGTVILLFRNYEGEVREIPYEF